MNLPAPILSTDKVNRIEKDLASIIPVNRRKAYNMRKLLNLVVDKDSFFEMSKFYGPSLITGLARLNGHSVAILANDCMYYLSLIHI